MLFPVGLSLLRSIQALESSISTLEREYEAIEALKVEVSPLQRAKDKTDDAVKVSEPYIPECADSNEF